MPRSFPLHINYMHGTDALAVLMLAALASVLQPARPIACLPHCRQHSSIAPGKTLVVGTQEGLYARVRRFERPALVLTSTAWNGEVHGPAEFPLDPAVLLEGNLLSARNNCLIRFILCNNVGEGGKEEGGGG